MTPTVETPKPAVPDPPADLQDARRLWPSMWQRAVAKNKPMSHDERFQLLHESLLSFDKGNAPGLNQAERAAAFTEYFKNQQELGLILEVDRLGGIT